MPIALPKGVKANIAGDVSVGQVVSIEGPKGKMSEAIGSGVTAAMEGDTILMSLTGTDTQSRANWGTSRALVGNMVKGVTDGFSKELEIEGVGFGFKVQGQKVVLSVGFTHEVIFDLPAEIKATTEKNTLKLVSSNRQMLGMYASRIRNTKKAEPYLGKGIKFAGQKVRRKAGKTGKK